METSDISTSPPDAPASDRKTPGRRRSPMPVAAAPKPNARGGPRVSAVARELVFDLIAVGFSNREILRELHKQELLAADVTLSDPAFSRLRKHADVVKRREVLMVELRDVAKSAMGLVLANRIRVERAAYAELVTTDGELSGALTPARINALNGLLVMSGGTIGKFFGASFVDDVDRAGRTEIGERVKTDEERDLDIQQGIIDLLRGHMARAQSGLPLRSPRLLLVGTEDDSETG